MTARPLAGGLLSFGMLGGEARADLVKSSGAGRVGLQSVIGRADMLTQPAFNGFFFVLTHAFTRAMGNRVTGLKAKSRKNRELTCSLASCRGNNSCYDRL